MEYFIMGEDGEHIRVTEEIAHLVKGDHIWKNKDLYEVTCKDIDYDYHTFVVHVILQKK